MDFGRLPRSMLSWWVPHTRPVGRMRFTYGETVNKSLRNFGFDKTFHGITWQELVVKRRIWKSLLCPNNFYTGISRTTNAIDALARVNVSSLLRDTTNTGTKLRQPWESAKYVTIHCMDIGYRSLVVDRAWVRGKSASNPKVNLDISGVFGFWIFGNPQAQTWLSDAIEAIIWGNYHPAFITQTQYELNFY